MIFAAWEKGWIKMSEYIERDRLLKVLEHNFYGIGGAGVMRQLIEMQPAAGAAPVRRGRWIEKPYLLGTSRFCSRCGENYGMQHAIYRYCPNCGARMDGEESK